MSNFFASIVFWARNDQGPWPQIADFYCCLMLDESHLLGIILTRVQAAGSHNESSSCIDHGDQMELSDWSRGPNTELSLAAGFHYIDYWGVMSWILSLGYARHIMINRQQGCSWKRMVHGSQEINDFVDLFLNPFETLRTRQKYGTSDSAL